MVFVILSATKDLNHISMHYRLALLLLFVLRRLQILHFVQNDKRCAFVILSTTKDLKHSSNVPTFSNAPSFCSSSLADPSLRLG